MGANTERPAMDVFFVLGLTDPDAKTTVFKSLKKFRRLFLEEFDINYIVDEGEGGRRNENFSLAFKV